MKGTVNSKMETAREKFSAELERVENNKFYAEQKGVEISAKGENLYNTGKILHDASSSITAIPAALLVFATLSSAPVIIQVISTGIFLSSFGLAWFLPISSRIRAIQNLIKSLDKGIKTAYKKSTKWRVESVKNGRSILEKKHYFEYSKNSDMGIVEVTITKNNRKESIRSIKKYSVNSSTKNLDYTTSNPLMETIDTWDKAFESAKQKNT